MAQDQEIETSSEDLLSGYETTKKLVVGGQSSFLYDRELDIQQYLLDAKKKSSSSKRGISQYGSSNQSTSQTTLINSVATIDDTEDSTPRN